MPNTAEEKPDPSLNAVRHGCCAKTVILPGEDEADFTEQQTTENDRLSYCFANSANQSISLADVFGRQTGCKTDAQWSEDFVRTQPGAFSEGQGRDDYISSARGSSRTHFLESEPEA